MKAVILAGGLGTSISEETDLKPKPMTGGRLKRVAPYLQGEEAFCFTYGDDVSNINISKLVEFHKKHGKDATLTSVSLPGRFGALDIHDNQIKTFTECARQFNRH